MPRVAVTKKALTKKEKETPLKKPVKRVPKKSTTKISKTKTSSTKNSEVINLEPTINKVSKVNIKSRIEKAKVVGKKQEANTITLPTKITPSIAKRIRDYESILLKTSPQMVAKVARTSGYSFVFVGFLFCFLALSSYPNKTPHLSAVNCNDSSCAEFLSATAKSEPNISYDESFNKTPTQNFSVGIDVTNASDLQVVAISRATGRTIALQREKIAEGQYKVTIPVTSLSPDTYTLFFRATASDAQSKYDFLGSEFVIKPKTESSTTTNSTNSPQEVEEPPSTTRSVETTNITTTNTNNVDFVETVITASRIENLGDYSSLKINAPRAGFVEVYAKGEMSTVETFLGLAVKSGTGWVFEIKNYSLPVGTYAVLAKTVVDSKTYTSNLVTYTSVRQPVNFDKPADNNEVQSSVFIEKTEVSVIEPDKTEEVVEKENVLKQREVYYTEAETIPHPEDTEEVEDTTPPRVDLAETDKTKLDNLLKRYGSAVQAKNENLIRLAETEIDNYRNELLSKVSATSDTDDSRLKINEDIQREIDYVKNKIVRYENILAIRSNLISRDSDQDGITDYDEATLYKTDAFSTDTDGDGVLDSVEILRGFDPLDASPESVVNFRSPLEYNYVDEENLIINSVIPVVSNATNETPVKVLTEIRGKGFPNSFVTLYVFSSPTIITIQTDRYGNFEYVFTKELEDGEHEVYVAVTDNTGEIVARSNPFRFTKTAEAYTVAGEVTNTYNLPPGCENEDCIKETKLSAYNLTAGLATVSFGLVLLMIGSTLKLRPEDEEITEKHVDKA